MVEGNHDIRITEYADCTIFGLYGVYGQWLILNYGWLAGRSGIENNCGSSCGNQCRNRISQFFFSLLDYHNHDQKKDDDDDERS
jgi:hypothetical protein